MTEELGAQYIAIANALVREVPEDWARVVAQASLRDGELAVAAHFYDRSLAATARPIDPGPVPQAFSTLRALMDADAPWAQATFTLLPNGLFDCAFDYA